MNITQGLKNLLSIYHHSREKGYTTLIKRLEEKNQAQILVSFQKDKHEFKDPIVIFGQNVEGYKFEKPLIMDNKLVLDIAQGSLSKIESQFEIINHLKKEVNELHDKIDFQRKAMRAQDKIMDTMFCANEVIEFAKYIRWKLFKSIPKLLSHYKCKK